MQWRSVIRMSISVSLLVVFVRASNELNSNADPLVKSDSKTPSEIEALLKEYRIIPDVLDVAPNHSIEIQYESHLKSSTRGFGTILNKSDVEEIPVRVVWPYTPWSFSTLILTDPDVLSSNQSTGGEFPRWIMVNIFEGDWKHGEVLTVRYTGTFPQGKTGTHRFVFIMFEQPEGRIFFDEPNLRNCDISSKEKRNNFSTVDFAKKYKFEPPYAVNFFQVKV